MFERTSPALLVCVAALVGGCGAASSPTATVQTAAAADPVVAGDGNQQGADALATSATGADPLAPSAAGTTALSGGAPGGAPWTGRIVIWCRDTHGAGCMRVSSLLGASPKTDGNVPADLLAVADAPSDCDEPVIAAMRAHLSSGLGMSDVWAEQIGDSLDQSSVPRRYSAAGCIGSGSPSIKISSSTTSPRYLVRVWEGDSD